MGLTLWGNPVLDEVCAPVLNVELGEGFAAHCERMLRVMYAAEGAGLAAPQIGDSRRYFVYDCDGHRGVVVNPVIVWRSRTLQTDDLEGCLSVPGFRWETPRAEAVTVEGLDAAGDAVTVEASGYLARCMQHEVDHLEGRLYLSRLGGKTGRRAKAAALAADWYGESAHFFDVA